MTEQTARSLQEAMAEEDQARTEADVEKLACIGRVARELPAKLDAVARGVAHNEPEVTKSLGAEGVQRLRAELASEGATLGADLAEAADSIKWPSSSSEFSSVSASSIHSALFGYLYGPRVDQLAGVLKKYGYDIRDDSARGGQGLILPQHLYEEAWFGPLGEALNELVSAERRTRRAKKDDDDSAVDAMWET